MVCLKYLLIALSSESEHQFLPYGWEATHLHYPEPKCSQDQPRRIEAKVKYHPATRQSYSRRRLVDSLLLSS
jgi:hypothetical protein